MPKRSFYIVLTFLCSLCLSNAVKASIAIVDPSAIISKYPKAQKALKEIADAEALLQGKIDQKRKQINEARKQNKTDTEIQMLVEQLKVEIEPEAEKLEEKSKKRSEELEKEINIAIEAIAKEGKYDMVLVKPAILYGGTDINDAVLKKLSN